jgi:GNAT superfamily N-acetyltransferase/predicted nucleic acid-binding protein
LSSAVTVHPIAPEDPRIEDVLALHRSAKGWLGFLPNAGFFERAEKRTLLVATAGESVVGYALFDLPRNNVKLVHLCVSDERRGKGIAQRLVAEISDRHRDRHGIELACRRDYPAHDAWPRLGFTAIGERQGRSNAGLPLTIWFRDHGHPDLFSTAPVVRELVAIDQVILNDLTTDRAEGHASHHLLDDWVSEAVELCVTSENYAETNRCEDSRLRADLRATASGMRQLARGLKPSPELLDQIRGIVSWAGPADHRHVALAILGGARYLVTRDRGLLRGAEGLERAFSLGVLAPETLIAQLDHDRREDLYEPAALENTQIRASRLQGDQQDAFVDAFQNTAAGERKAELRNVVEQALAAPQLWEVTIFEEGHQLVGGVVRRRTSETLIVAAIRTGPTNRLTRTLARHLAYAQRRTAALEGLRCVEITDPCPTPDAIRALSAEAYAREGVDAWRSVVMRGFAIAGDAADLRLHGVATREAAGALERTRWPLKVIGAGIPTYMVAIEAAWAESLFDAILAEGQLFPRDGTLGLSREHVYYRSAFNGHGISSPARILWYVKAARTRGSGIQRTAHLRAVSHLDEVIRERPRTLHQRFARLGAWTREQVETAAGGRRQAMALKVVDTEILARPISLDGLRAIYRGVGESFHPPQAPAEVDEEMFRRLYERSSAYAT